MDQLAGQVIRGYQFHKVIGSGGYGVVYEATEQAVDRRVAVKVITPDHANQPEFISSFEAEARLVAQLEHPNIVPLYTYWQDEKGAFLVMRYIRGGSLRELLRRQGAIGLAQTVRIVEQIAQGLHAAHEAGVVHRDLKPDNILIDERGNAYLTDFGIAKRLDAGGDSATGGIKGTFAYLSPEQIEAKRVLPQTDIYALGIMLYEMLAGQHPFHETPVAMLVMKHLQERLPDLTEKRPDLPEEIEFIIERATAKLPQDRFSSVLDLVADLNELNANGHARAVSTAYVPPVPTARKIPTTAEERNRHSMLGNVRNFWIEGVLEQSLFSAAMIELGLEQRSGAVDNPWDTVLRTTDGSEERLPGSANIVAVFERLNGKLLILGDPGGGKTTTMLGLTRALLQRAEQDEAHPIPVVFNLSSWGEKRLPLEQWLVEELNAKYQVPRKVADAWVEADHLLLLLDGLDEVPAAVRADCVQVINAYRAEHGFVDMVVCSRIKDYEALTTQLKLNGAIVIQPLNDQQIDAYVQGLGPDVATVRDMIARDEQLRELAKSPLMLSVMLLAYRGVSSEEIPDFDDVEKQRQHLFDIYVRRIFQRRMAGADYSQEQTRHYLSWLARLMQQHSLSVFHLENLQPTWLSPTQFRLYLRWVSALAIVFMVLTSAVPYAVGSHLLGLSNWIMGIGNGFTGLFIALNILRARQLRLVGPLLIGISGIITWSTAIGSVTGLAQGLWVAVPISIIYVSSAMITNRFIQRSGSTDQYIPVLDQLRFSLQAVNPLAGVAGILSGIVFPLPGIGWIFWPSEVGLARVGLGMLGGGVALGLGFMVQSGMTVGEVSTRSRPNQGMRGSLANANQGALLSVVNFVVAGLLGIVVLSTFTFGLTLGTLIGLGSIAVLWLAYGGYSVLRHIMLRLILDRAGVLPLNLARFLDHASALILMRKVGGGYIFIHRYLLEYFASQADEA